MSRIMLIIGIIFTILSVFISYYVINKSQEKIDALRVEISQYEDKINSSWRTKKELEQKYVTSIMLYTLVVNRADNDPARIAACNYVHDVVSYHDIKVDQNSCGGIEFLPDKLKELDMKTVSSINDFYVKKLSLESDLMDLQRTSKIIQAIGLFLQVVGLILVLYFKP